MAEHYYYMSYMRPFNAAPAFIIYLRTHKVCSDKKKKQPYLRCQCSGVASTALVCCPYKSLEKESPCHLENAPNYELASIAKEYLSSVWHYVPAIYQAFTF